MYLQSVIEDEVKKDFYWSSRSWLNVRVKNVQYQSSYLIIIICCIRLRLMCSIVSNLSKLHNFHVFHPSTVRVLTIISVLSCCSLDTIFHLDRRIWGFICFNFCVLLCRRYSKYYLLCLFTVFIKNIKPAWYLLNVPLLYENFLNCLTWILDGRAQLSPTLLFRFEKDCNVLRANNINT